MTTTTAEWICTRCGSTNRILVPDGATRATDECLTCHTRHALEVDARPVRWRATSQAKAWARHGTVLKDSVSPSLPFRVGT